MASLVADYGTSSGSDSDTEESTKKSDVKPEREVAGINLLESQGDDGKDDSDSDDNVKSTKSASRSTETALPAVVNSPLPNPLAASSKLPSPALGYDHRPETSVFVTAFHRAAEAKSSILEQHVKMTDSDLPAEVGGKKICWNFRKGKCRFGHKCKYSHGAEIRGNTGLLKVNGEDTEANATSSLTHPGNTHQLPPQHAGVHPSGHNQFQAHHGNMAYQPQGPGYRQPWPHGKADGLPDEDDYLSNAKRKKRAGVTDTLVPPKRAMRELDRFRQEERPWTVPK